jgi:hypothetical protein
MAGRADGIEARLRGRPDAAAGLERAARLRARAEALKDAPAGLVAHAGDVWPMVSDPDVVWPADDGDDDAEV